MLISANFGGAEEKYLEFDVKKHQAKFGAFVRRVPISPKNDTKPPYYMGRFCG